MSARETSKDRGERSRYDEYEDDRDEAREDEAREYEDDREEPRLRERPARKQQPDGISAADVGEGGLRQIESLTGREPLGVTSVTRTDDGWVVEVEVVEDRRIPSSADILALYEVELDIDGTLLGYHRTSRYARGRTDR